MRSDVRSTADIFRTDDFWLCASWKMNFDLDVGYALLPPTPVQVNVLGTAVTESNTDGFDPDAISLDDASDDDLGFEDHPPFEVGPSPLARFVRGDVDGSTAVDGLDLVILAERIGGVANRVSCDKAADLDDDGFVLPADLGLLADLVALGTPVPPAPFPACDFDPTFDGLSCQVGCP